MRDDDLKDFFTEDAYNELLNAYAEEDSRKARARAEKETPKKTVSSDTRRIPVQKAPTRPVVKKEPPVSKTPMHTASQRPDIQRTPRSTPLQHTASAKNTNSTQQHKVYDLDPILPLSPAQPPHKTGEFKLEIKGLDEEFNTQPAPRRPRMTQDKNTNKTSAQKTGAFENFAEVIKKRRPAHDPAEGNALVTEAFEEEEQAAIVKKKRPEKIDLATVKAFFLQNKKTWIIIAVCVVCSICLSIYSISCLNDVFAVHRDTETVTVNIPADANTKTVLKILQENDLIEHRHFCLAVAKIMEFKDDNYLTGVYYVTPSMGVEKMLSTFKVAPTSGETVTLTFPEGYTVDQILEKLEKYEVCTAAVMNQTMYEVDFSNEFAFIKEEDNKEARYHMLEGYLYPDTYEFYVGESPSSVLRKFLTNFNNKWTEEYAEQAKKLNMSVDDVVTLASIIQKEAYGTDQSPLVSSVLHNRLNNSGLYPSLQCDSTTEYINEYIQPHTTDAAKLAKFTTLYSSYRCVGLPVGAICNPGDDAIHAALYPEDTGYYFFAHDVNKKLYLARNDNERRSNNIAILNANSEAEKKQSN